MTEYKSNSGKPDESKGYKGVHGGGGKRNKADKVVVKLKAPAKIKMPTPRETKMMTDSKSQVIGNTRKSGNTK